MQIKFEASELEERNYLGEGEHDCRITNVEHKQSKKGDPMVEVTFSDATTKTTRDWFMLTGNKFKLAGLALATGVPKASLLSGDFTTEMLKGRQVKVIRKITGKDAQGRNNYENSYLASGAMKPSESDDSLPF